ncbi:hypothetical protein GGS23DRAFT_180091 [Durotheca rogersii]|uniref:uncharacterized protein n=1 Tax=Durotheca rogersii TaxID=419775 RepID=UPI00221EAED8|nr:uncharacterized protein GGS23DRAFT_180091 [Durotheca rogersii]KAI5867490.1 hypothetical protein GGS23DRAFT_180091 [Durotheca rogersii]
MGRYVCTLYPTQHCTRRIVVAGAPPAYPSHLRAIPHITDKLVEASPFSTYLYLSHTPSPDTHRCRGSHPSPPFLPCEFAGARREREGPSPIIITHPPGRTDWRVARGRATLPHHLRLHVCVWDVGSYFPRYLKSLDGPTIYLHRRAVPSLSQASALLLREPPVACITFAKDGPVLSARREAEEGQKQGISALCRCLWMCVCVYMYVRTYAHNKCNRPWSPLPLPLLAPTLLHRRSCPSSPPPPGI